MSTKRLTAAEVVAELRRREQRKYEKGVGAAEGNAGAIAVALVAQASALYEAAGLIEQHLIETPEKSRERFEQWQAVAYPGYSRGRYAVTGDYMADGLQTLWEAWEASRTFRSEQGT